MMTGLYRVVDGVDGVDGEGWGVVFGVLFVMWRAVGVTLADYVEVVWLVWLCVTRLKRIELFELIGVSIDDVEV